MGSEMCIRDRLWPARQVLQSLYRRRESARTELNVLRPFTLLWRKHRAGCRRRFRVLPLPLLVFAHVDVLLRVSRRASSCHSRPTEFFGGIGLSGPTKTRQDMYRLLANVTGSVSVDTLT